jgi:hypothetical protein
MVETETKSPIDIPALHCGKCNKQYQDASAYVRHMQIKHDIVIDKDTLSVPTYQCPACDHEPFQKLGSLKSHMTKKHADYTPEASVPNIKRLMAVDKPEVIAMQRMLAHDKNTYEKEVIGNGNANGADEKKKQDDTSEVLVSKDICPDCRKIVYSFFSHRCTATGKLHDPLQSSTAADTNDSGWQCPFCIKKFVTKQALSQHSLNVHMEDTGAVVPVKYGPDDSMCPFCHERFGYCGEARMHYANFDGPACCPKDPRRTQAPETKKPEAPLVIHGPSGSVSVHNAKPAPNSRQLLLTPPPDMTDAQMDKLLECIASMCYCMCVMCGEMARGT